MLNHGSTDQLYSKILECQKYDEFVKSFLFRLSRLRGNDKELLN